MTVHVLTICGSLQARSANRAVLDLMTAMFEERRPSPVEVDDASELATIAPFNADREADPGNAVLSFRARLGRAGVVIIATPEYAGALPGALKNALDWIVGSAELYTKPALVISAGTTGGNHARQQLIQTLTWQGAHVVGELGIAAPRTKSDATGRFTDPATIEAIRRMARLAVDIHTLGTDARRALVDEVVTTFGIDRHHIAPLGGAQSTGQGGR